MPRYSLYARQSKPMTHLCGAAFLHQPLALLPSENRGHCLNCHEDSHSLRQCRHPFINASGCLNPDLGQVGDDGEAYRRWQARMNRCRRQDKSSRSNKQSNNQNRRRRGNSRGQPQSQGQASTQNDGFYTLADNGNQQSGSGHHGGVPPSPASSAVAPSRGIRYGASQNPGGNPNARQPGTFGTGN